MVDPAYSTFSEKAGALEDEDLLHHSL